MAIMPQGYFAEKRDSSAKLPDYQKNLANFATHST
jgi:hypothetical protein